MIKNGVMIKYEVEEQEWEKKRNSTVLKALKGRDVNEESNNGDTTSCKTKKFFIERPLRPSDVIVFLIKSENIAAIIPEEFTKLIVALDPIDWHNVAHYLLIAKNQEDILFALIDHLISKREQRTQLIVQTFIFTLEQELLYYSIVMYKRYQHVLMTFYWDQSVNAIATSLNKTVYFYEYKVFLFEKFFEFAKFRHIKQFMYLLDQNLKKSLILPHDSNDSRPSILLYSTNAVKLIMMIYHLLDKIRVAFPATRYKCIFLMDDLINKAKHIIDEVEEEDQMKLMLKEEDLDGRNSLWFMATHNIYNILDTTVMDRIIYDLWRSNIDVTGTFMEASSNF
jgi:hypothetical protein